jgi:hypothetical protein
MYAKGKAKESDFKTEEGADENDPPVHSRLGAVSLSERSVSPKLWTAAIAIPARNWAGPEALRTRGSP